MNPPAPPTRVSLGRLVNKYATVRRTLRIYDSAVAPNDSLEFELGLCIDFSAVLFETVPLIRGNLSNVIYFFLFVLLVVTVTNPSRGQGLFLAEPSGIGILLDTVKSAGLDCGAQTSLRQE